MQQHRKTGLALVVISLFCLCAGFVWAKAAVIVGMVTEMQGHAYWQNDTKKNRVQELAELPENAKLVMAKGSKLTLVYLASGQQYELNGPSVVQFKHSKPVALNGMMPKTVGAAPAMTEKKRIDPKSVQTAGQTLVSTEAQKDSYEPAAYAAAPPPPTPAPAPALATPRLIATSPAPAKAVAKAASPAAKERRERMQAYEAAKLAADGETAASVARESEIAAQEAARRAAEATAAKSQRRQTECEPETGNKKTDAEKDSEKSGTSIVKTATDCSPLIIEQQN